MDSSSINVSGLQIKEMVTKQTEIGTELEKLRSNFKKEPKTRQKNLDRVMKFANEANDYINQFRKNHEFLTTVHSAVGSWSFQGTLAEYKYFKDEYDKTVEAIYDVLRNLITVKLEALNASFPEIPVIDEPSTSNETDEYQNTINNEQSDLNGLSENNSENEDEFLDTTQTRAHGSTPTNKRNEKSVITKFAGKLVPFEDELDSLENYVMSGLRARAQAALPYLSKKYEQLTSEFDELCQENNMHHFREKFRVIRDRFYSLIEEIGERPQHQQQMEVQQQRGNIRPFAFKLKDIEIENFDGAIQKWPTYCELFTSMVIDNECYNDLHRMHYLKSTLTGEAAKLIANYDISGQYFTTAWQLLKKKYENPRELRYMHLNTLMNQPKVMNESAFHLRKLYETSRDCTALLKSTTAEQMMIFMILNKIDKETHMSYQQTVNWERDESLEELLSFLEKRCQVLELVNTRAENEEKKKSEEHNNNKNTKCLFCNNTNCFALYKCRKFRSVSVAERRKFVHEKKLCLLCLQNNHMVEKCFLKNTCSKCSRKHNELLHYDNEESKENTKNNNKQFEHKPLQRKALLAMAAECQTDTTNERDSTTDANEVKFVQSCKR